MKKLMMFFIIISFIISFVTAQQNTMIRIEGGSFLMGSPDDEVGRFNNEVQHQVTVSSFYMSKYEITQKEYRDVMGVNPSRFKGDNLPVEMVTWFDVIEYCNKRSEKEGLTPVYIITERTPVNGYPITSASVAVEWNNNGYRLPTEAEWEYACRSGTTTRYYFGNNITTNNANYNKSSSTGGEKTTPVGTFAANTWGLHDMHGNVWEWCWDWYGAYESGTLVNPNPRGASKDTRRIVRGGSWSNGNRDLRSARRAGSIPDFRSSYFGFRVVRQ